ncbi:nickel-dependent lactate racemase family protein [Geomonas azotofigens]|uniref:nickel-dependent lactate racemase n=1 Tax=Geomonas azotofigens TaxID=2843196 RepID=UPI001C10743A|nr:nickel-dependent lactate racemase [Geomonas azotofigens]MBU5614242.1 nickel-dependent lactate racemase [Geomonas azotofigens]
MYHNPMLELKCGDHNYPLQLPPERLLSVLSPRPFQRLGTPVELVERTLDGCTGSLASFAPGDRVVIVTSDVTRPTGSEVYLPLLVSRLNSIGIRDRDIEIVVALGIHRKQTPAEHKKIVGELYGRIKVTDHDCDDPGALVYLGDTARGVPVEVNRRVTEADRVILTGAVTFHYFAGFGGGRKSILPGVSSRKSCMASHFALLNPDEGSGRHPKAVAGSLEGNPVHEAMLEACGMVAPDFILNTVLGPDKQIIAAFAGDWRAAHLAGCRFYNDTFSAPIDEKGDLVIVSCGGYPKDINLIQAHKSMEYGSRALKPGGAMILLAECRDGYGNATFFNWFGYETCAELESALRKRYEINGQTAWSVKEKAERFRIVLVSKLPAEEVRTMGMIPASTLDEALALAAPMLSDDYRAYLIPEGGTVLPVMKA